MKFLYLSAFLLASGVSASDTRIVNGETAEPGQFPFYATLYRNGAVDKDNFVCGGSLIAPNFVVTAAHCDQPNFVVVVGNSDIDGEGTEVVVDKKFKHEDWNRRKILNDIMLLRLAEPVVDLPPVEMNFDAGFPIEDEDDPPQLTAIGLGRTSQGGPVPDKLQYATKDLFSFDSCKAKYVPELGGWFEAIVGFFREMNVETQICAGGDGEIDVCNGDSGGPLITEGEIQVGLTSFGAGCARAGFPSVYTRLSGFEDWIKTRVCDAENIIEGFEPDYCDGYVPPEPETGGGGVGGGFFCFSGIDTVEVENVGTVEMKSLNIGDSILVAPNKYEPVYSFGHRSDVLETEFLKVVASNGAKLEITKDHLVFVDKDVSVPASDLKHGMQLLHSGELTSVKSIKTVVRKGLYAPFTPSGKLVVNGFEVSSFVAINGSATVKLFGMELHYQTISSLFESPRRLVCHVFGKCTEETYNEDGMSTWHSVALKSYQWLLDQNMVTFHVGFTFAFLVVGLVSAFELFVTSTVALPLIMCVSLILARNYTSAKKTN